jgi:hypothetical protein
MNNPWSLWVIPHGNDLCYTENMSDNQHIWRAWANTAYRWGVGEWIASFLEAAGPLSILGAQLVYLLQPILRMTIAEKHLDVLARTLEEPSETRAFITLLREVPTP